MLTREAVIDRITQLLIENYDSLGIDIEDVRKRINEGTISTGSEGKPVLYQYDEKAYSNELNFIDDIVETCGGNCFDENIDTVLYLEPGTTSIYLNGDPFNDLSSGNITEFWTNNISQFLTFDQQTHQLDPTQANDILDTDIYELLQQSLTRQEMIDKFFSDYAELKGDPPEVDANSNDIGDYDENHDITDNGEYIPRLNDNDGIDNVNQTLEWLRNDLKLFFPEEFMETETPELPEYVNKSDGYLKFRGLNQAIIVRNVEKDDIGLMKEVTTTACSSTPGPSYLCDGFTITMWVRFLDKVSSGTLFNFGNPTRTSDPMGFKLETFIDTNTEERFLKLSV